MNKDGEESREMGRATMRWLSVGIEFCIVVCLFAFLGHVGDRFLGSSPWLMVAGFFVGFFVMIYWLVQSTRDMQ